MMGNKSLILLESLFLDQKDFCDKKFSKRK